MKSGDDVSSVQALESALLRSDSAGAREILKGSCNPDEPYTCISTLIEPALRSIGEQWAEGVPPSHRYM